MFERDEFFEVGIVAERPKDITTHGIRQQIAEALAGDTVVQERACSLGDSIPVQLGLYVVVAAWGHEHRTGRGIQSGEECCIGRGIAGMEGDEDVAGFGGEILDAADVEPCVREAEIGGDATAVVDHGRIAVDTEQMDVCPLVLQNMIECEAEIGLAAACIDDGQGTRANGQGVQRQCDRDQMVELPELVGHGCPYDTVGRGQVQCMQQGGIAFRQERVLFDAVPGRIAPVEAGRGTFLHGEAFGLPGRAHDVQVPFGCLDQHLSVGESGEAFGDDGNVVTAHLGEVLSIRL